MGENKTCRNGGKRGAKDHWQIKKKKKSKTHTKRNNKKNAARSHTLLHLFFFFFFFVFFLPFFSLTELGACLTPAGKNKHHKNNEYEK